MAVVGHVEWTEFLHVDRVPAAGEIAHSTWARSEPAGGGAVAAVAIAQHTGSCQLFTALGDDDLAERARARLTELGVTVLAITRDAPTRRALTLIDPSGERTITTVGPRLEPRAADPLPWVTLGEMDAVYVTAGDRGALEAARAAPLLAATPRVGTTLDGLQCDVLVYSAADAGEKTLAAQLSPPAALRVATEGRRGGSWERTGGERGRWEAVVANDSGADDYGAGDWFAATLVSALAAGQSLQDALGDAAAAGARAVESAGPYGMLALP